MEPYKTKIKCIINPILRSIQFCSKKPFVIYSNFNSGKKFTGYGFGRIFQMSYHEVLKTLW